MEKIDVHLNNEHSVGLGDNLCLLSALANLPPQVNLQVSNDHNTFDKLTLYKKIFRIPNDSLTITLSDTNGTFNNVGWPIKFFTDYYRPQFVNVNGQTLKVRDGKEKKCIAIAASFDLNDAEADMWPWCRARPLEYWARVFMYLKKLGYDVITVDYPYHDLENKIELLTKNCKAIISYEGGMAHLAHMLKLPCFLIDWKLPSPSTTLNTFHCEFVHKTDSVFIVRDEEEFLTWGEGKFNDKIADLARGKGNNRLVTGDCKVNFSGPNIHGQMSVINEKGFEVLKAPGLFGDSVHSEILSRYYK